MTPEIGRHGKPASCPTKPQSPADSMTRSALLKRAGLALVTAGVLSLTT